MTITTQTFRAQYNGNGATTEFSIPFEFIDQTGVKVIHTDDDGVDTTWVHGTQYTITNNDGTPIVGRVQPATGKVVVDTSPTDYTPATGERLTILRNEPFTQAASYTENGPFPAKAHERALDRLDMQIHTLKEQINRSPKYAETSTNSVGPIFPEPEADKIIGWNADGDGLENKTGLEDSVAAAAASAAAALASEGAAAASEATASAAASAAQTAETNAETAETNAEAAQAAAEAAAAGVNLPIIQPGDAGKQLYVKDTEDGYELADAAFVVAAVTTGGSAAANSAAFDAAAVAAGNGTVFIPPGIYDANDLTIAAKGSGTSGGFKVMAQGVILNGTGKLIIDSCKRVVIEGLDAPGMSLCLRGCWWLKAYGLRMHEVRYGDVAGTTFSTNYWNSYYACLFQRTVVDTNAGTSNAQNFFDCQLRGHAQQGFSGAVDYNVEFNGNVDCQNWNFTGGDVSYATVGVYSIDAGNTEEVELTFDGTYFDTFTPIPSDRANLTIITRGCHAANNLPNAVSISAIAHGGMELFRSDRGVGWQPYGGLNLIRNGEFRKTQAVYVGANLPFGSANSATITAQTGAGWHGNYWNLNQPATTSNSFSMRCASAPWKGRYTGTMIIRNANAGAKTMRATFLGLSFELPISDSEWTVATVTTKAEIAAGTQLNLQVFTNDTTAFNVDVAYGCIAFGEAPPVYLPSQAEVVLDGSVTHNVGSLVDGAGETFTITVTGAALGDFALASFPGTLSGMSVTAYVSAADTVSVRVQNESGSTIDLSSSTWRARVFKVL